jgi:hypothetical protein
MQTCCSKDLQHHVNTQLMQHVNTTLAVWLQALLTAARMPLLLRAMLYMPAHSCGADTAQCCLMIRSDSYCFCCCFHCALSTVRWWNQHDIRGEEPPQRSTADAYGDYAEYDKASYRTAARLPHQQQQQVAAAAPQYASYQQQQQQQPTGYAQAAASAGYQQQQGGGYQAGGYQQQAAYQQPPAAATLNPEAAPYQATGQVRDSVPLCSYVSFWGRGGPLYVCVREG